MTKVPGVLLLALETSAVAGSVAVFEGDRLLAERQLDPARRSAQTLAPAMADLLTSAGIAPPQIKLVALTVGPGSFTGLRVGITAAKTFAYAVGADLLGFNTLDAIAAQTPDALRGPVPVEIQSVLDAQRKEFFVARFRATAAECHRLGPDAIEPAQAWLGALRPGTIVTGPGLQQVEDLLPPGVIAVEASLRQPQAATVGRLAWRAYQQGQRHDLWKLAPHYVRASAAEEKAARGKP